MISSFGNETRQLSLHFLHLTHLFQIVIYSMGGSRGGRRRVVPITNLAPLCNPLELMRFRVVSFRYYGGFVRIFEGGGIEERNFSLQCTQKDDFRKTSTKYSNFNELRTCNQQLWLWCLLSFSTHFCELISLISILFDYISAISNYYISTPTPVTTRFETDIFAPHFVNYLNNIFPPLSFPELHVVKVSQLLLSQS